MNAPLKNVTACGLPDWFRREGESWSDWEYRMMADRERLREAREKVLRDYPPPNGICVPAVGVGTWDCNGVPKGRGWQA